MGVTAEFPLTGIGALRLMLMNPGAEVESTSKGRFRYFGSRLERLNRKKAWVELDLFNLNWAYRAANPEATIADLKVWLEKNGLSAKDALELVSKLN